MLARLLYAERAELISEGNANFLEQVRIVGGSVSCQNEFPEVVHVFQRKCKFVGRQCELAKKQCELLGRLCELPKRLCDLHKGSHVVFLV